MFASESMYMKVKYPKYFYLLKHHCLQVLLYLVSKIESKDLIALITVRQ